MFRPWGGGSCETCVRAHERVCACVCMCVCACVRPRVRVCSGAVMAGEEPTVRVEWELVGDGGQTYGREAVRRRVLRCQLVLHHRGEQKRPHELRVSGLYVGDVSITVISGEANVLAKLASGSCVGWSRGAKPRLELLS